MMPRLSPLAACVIVIVINVLFAAHTHASMARTSLAQLYVVLPPPYDDATALSSRRDQVDPPLCGLVAQSSG